VTIDYCDVTLPYVYLFVHVDCSIILALGCRPSRGSISSVVLAKCFVRSDDIAIGSNRNGIGNLKKRTG